MSAIQRKRERGKDKVGEKMEGRGGKEKSER